MNEPDRIRAFYQRKLEELSRKCESRVRAARSMSGEKTAGTPLGELETLRAENEVLRIRLEEACPDQKWVTHEVSDLVELRRQAAATEKYRVQASRLADQVKRLEKSNADLQEKLQKSEKNQQRSSSNQLLERRILLLEQRIQARERALERIIQYRDGDILETLERERKMFLAKLAEKKAEAARYAEELHDLEEVLSRLGIELPGKQ